MPSPPSTTISPSMMASLHFSLPSAAGISPPNFSVQSSPVRVSSLTSVPAICACMR